MERILSAAEWDTRAKIISAELTKIRDPAYAPSLVQMHETLQKFHSIKATIKTVISQLKLIKLTAEEQRFQKVIHDFEDLIKQKMDETARDISDRTETPEEVYGGLRGDSEERGIQQVGEPPGTADPEGQPAAPDHPRTPTPYAIRYPRQVQNQRR